MDRLKLAITGCGDIAGYTALVSRFVPQVRLCACCDIDAARAGRFAKRHRIPRVFTEYADLLRNSGADAVYLAVPHHLHLDLACSAVQAGKPVFLEKPLTRTLAEADVLLGLAEQQGVKIGVNYQYRYDSGWYAAACAIRGGALGRVHSIRINIPWRRTQDYFDAAPWHRTIAQAGGGTLMTQGSHFLDAALWALDEAPASAMGYTASPGFDVEVETLAHGIVETRGGALVSISSTMAAARESAATIEAYGERGTAVYRDLPFPTVKFIGVKARREPPPQRGIHALQRSLAGFAMWILRGEPFLTPAASTRPVLAAVEGIYRSARSGKRERISA